MKTKICIKCGEEKSLSEFYKSKINKCGYTGQCKNCLMQQGRNNYYKKANKINKHKRDKYKEDSRKIKEQNRKYRMENPEKIRKMGKEYYKNNTDKIKKYNREQYEKNKDKIKKQHIEIYSKNPIHFNTQCREWQRKNALYNTYVHQISWCEEVRRDPDNKDYLQVRCKETGCRKWFNPTNQDVIHRIKSINDTGGYNFYCSDKCKQDCLIFNRSKYPKGFKYDYSREVQKELAELVFERDDYECQRCGFKENLQAHHYESIYQNPIESADIDMCVTLYKTCHKLTHKDIGCRPCDLTKKNLCKE